MSFRPKGEIFLDPSQFVRDDGAWPITLRAWRPFDFAAQGALGGIKFFVTFSRSLIKLLETNSQTSECKSLMRLARRTIKRARIEIIPMIDTIFFLLVFFMISTLSMSRYSGLPVNLPKAATGQQPASESAAVTITADGKVFIDKQEVPRENIRTVLQQRLVSES